MPRTTRAAARAKDAEIEIATDATATEPSVDHASDGDNSVDSDERPPLAEMTANAIEEVELAIALKDETRSPKKKAASRGTSPKKNAVAAAASKRGKGTKKGKKPTGKAATVVGQELLGRSSEEESAEEAASNKENFGSSPVGRVSEPAVEAASSPAAPADETSMQEDAPQTEAVAKLEGLFEQPSEIDMTGAVEQIASAATAAATAPQESEKPTEVKPKTSKTSEKSKSKSPKLAGSKPTASTVKDRRQTMTKRSPTSTLKRATIGPRTSMATQTKARLSTAAAPKSKPPEKPTQTEKVRSTIASLKTPPRPAKSTKAPTTSTFKLPGEGMAEKLKAQREERQKRQQEQAEKQKTAAPRPTIPPKTTTKPRAAPEVKLTKAAAARMSMSNTVKERPTSSVAKTAADKRSATFKPSHRPSLSVSSGNTIAKSARPATHARTQSVATVTKDVPQPTVVMTAAQKQEAAKKARAEAAERGRAASKAWAEKKREADMAKKAQGKPTENAEGKENAEPTAGPVEAQ